MKKVFCILSILTITTPALALSDANRGKIATAGFVKGAYDALDAAKQPTLSSTNVTQGTGAIVTSVTASNGAITVTRTNEVTVPVNSNNSSTRANVWIE